MSPNQDDKSGSFASQSSDREIGAAGTPAPPRSGSARSFLRLVAKFLLPVIVLGAAGGSYVYLKSTKPEVKQRAQREKAWPVKSMVAAFTDHQPVLKLYGVTVSGRRVEMRALVQGEIIEVGTQLREGGFFKKGDLLVKIDPFQFEGAIVEANAQLAEAEARLSEIEASITLERDALKFEIEQLEIAKRDLERAIPLAAKGTVSKKLADDRRLIVSQRRQSLQNRQNNLKVQAAKASQQRAAMRRLSWRVDQAKRNLRDTVLKAPFASYVTSVNAEIGRIVSVNDRVATLLDKGWIDVSFTLSDSQYGRILSSEKTVAGRDVEILWYVGNRPFIYKAKIERVSAEISSESGGVQVYARLTDSEGGAPIRAGAFVEVRVPDQHYKNVLRIPQTALYDGDKVYVIIDSRLQQRKIEVVGAAGTDILIRGPIKAGERILLTRLSTVGEGIKVRDVTSGEGNDVKTSSSGQPGAYKRTAKSKGGGGTANTKDNAGKAKPWTRR